MYECVAIPYIVNYIFQLYIVKYIFQMERVVYVSELHLTCIHDVSFEDQKGSCLDRDLQMGICDSWPKAKLRITGISNSSYMKLSNFFDIVDSFT